LVSHDKLFGAHISQTQLLDHLRFDVSDAHLFGDAELDHVERVQLVVDLAIFLDALVADSAHEVKIEFLFFDDREADREVGVECVGYSPASQTRDRRFELAVHQIGDDRRVAGFETIPVFLSNDVLGSVVVVTHLNIRLGPDTIQVLVDQVEQVVDEFG